MSEDSANVVRVLTSLSIGPMQNFEFSARDRRVVNRLWLAGYVRLVPGDVWFITVRGREMLDGASRPQGTAQAGFEVSRSE